MKRNQLLFICPIKVVIRQPQNQNKSNGHTPSSQIALTTTVIHVIIFGLTGLIGTIVEVTSVLGWRRRLSLWVRFSVGGGLFVERL